MIGPNGAGKTTLFNLIAGAMAPDGGSIVFAGQPIQGLPTDAICRRGLARTFQIVRPFPALSVEDNVIIGALQRHHDVEAARARARMLLQQLDLFDKRHRLAATLTLPDRKRLEVARALATEPQLLLLDEVMAGLRPTETDRMVAILRDAQPRQRLDDPADRARDARGHGARFPRAGARPRHRNCHGCAGRSGARSGGGAILSRR